ncbi:DUF1643 domain-containing protein [Thiomonas sp.]
MLSPERTIRPAALFSPDRRHRYGLWRYWGTGSRTVMFIGLNPSTADEIRDDPTVRRCIGYAKTWGFDQMCMTNLFAYRATLPADMRQAPDPIGPDNDRYLLEFARRAELVVAAWGAHGGHLDRETRVRHLLRDTALHCLGRTKTGHPKHPLYLRADLRPIPYGD